MSAAEHEAAIAQLLAELGDTADAVADKLRAKGIKGEREDYCDCALARCIKAETGLLFADVAAIKTVHAHVQINGWDGPRVPLPPPVAAFAIRFDDGVYLDLVEVP